MVAGEIGGLLCLLDRASGDQFTESDGRTLDILAAWTALAIDRAKLGSDVERRRQDSELAARHLFGARDVASAVGRRTNRRKLFGEIAARTLELARARATLLWLLDDRHLVLQAIAGLSTDRMPGQRIPVSGHASIVLSGGRPLHSTVDRGGELIRGKATRRLGDGEASLLVPIRISTAPIGILVAAGSGDRALFSTSEERRVERLAAGAAAALVLSGAVSYEGVGAVPTDGVGASQSSGLELADGLDVLAGLRMLLGSARRDPWRT
jgi:transcriptional regulator with GAF, ATPase, and Fis domain